MSANEMPDDLVFHQEWQRVLFTPDGERVTGADSNWVEDKTIARSLLNQDYPHPTMRGVRFMLRTRWVSEHRPYTVERGE
jgi:hypothetical protein